MQKKKQEKVNILMEQITEQFKNCDDFICQKITPENTTVEIFKVYINQLINTKIVDESILNPLADILPNITSSDYILEQIRNGKIYHTDIKIEIDSEKIIAKVLDGNFIVICEQYGFIFDVKGYAKRSIEEPNNETVVKGSKEGFIESLSTNVSLLRRRIATPKLKVVNKDIGSETKTPVSIIYMEGTAEQSLVDDVINRIDNMDIPSLTCNSDFEEHMVQRKYSLFPQIISTERADKVASNIIEGKICILIDGFPTAYIIPAVLAMFMQAPEGYGMNYFVASFIRIVRYIGLALAALLPAIYIAIVTFHQEMLPTTLAQSIINSKQDVPLPAFLEIIIMLFAFEVLLEAGIRMPKTAGQTVSIVGALIVGEAAVNAKFVSPAVVVIVAVSAICGFVIPNQDLSNAVRISRLGFVIVSSIAGLYGVSLATIAVMYYLCTLESFNVPYLKPFVSNNAKAILADTLIRTPINKRKNKMTRW